MYLAEMKLQLLMIVKKNYRDIFKIKIREYQAIAFLGKM